MFLWLLCLFDAFPCLIILSFDFFRFFSRSGKHGSGQPQSPVDLYSSTEPPTSHSEFNNSAIVRYGQDSFEEFGTYDGGSARGSTWQSFGPGGAERPNSSQLVIASTSI